MLKSRSLVVQSIDRILLDILHHKGISNSIRSEISSKRELIDELIEHGSKKAVNLAVKSFFGIIASIPVMFPTLERKLTQLWILLR